MRQHLIKHETEQRLLQHGLTLELIDDQHASSPRDDCDTVAVGIEVGIPKEYGRVGINELVHKYCDDYLDCSVDDIVWCSIGKYSHSGVSYSIGGSGEGWDNSIAGFIFLTKKDILDQYQVTEITEETINRVHERFDHEIKEYTQWANGEIYGISIEGGDDSVEAARYGLYDVDDYIDVAANELIDELIYSVDDSKGSVKVTLSVRTELAEYETALTKFISLMNIGFEFTPVIGTADHDTQTNEVTFNLVTSAMPSFLQLAANAQFNLFDKMQENWDRFSYKALSDNEAYSEWSDDMLTALIKSLLNNSDNFGVISVVGYKEVA